MKRLPYLLRAALAVLTGLLLANAIASPAAAGSTASFELQDVGEDNCTFFNTAGEAAWPSADDPARGPVTVSGKGWISYAPPETICLTVAPFPRHIAFTAYVDREPVASHTEPFDRIDDGDPFGEFAYDFALAAPDGAPIDYVTVQLCHTPTDGTGSGAVCDEPTVLEPEGIGTGA